MRIKQVETSNISDLIRIGEEVNLSPWTAQNYLEELKHPTSLMYRLADDENRTIGMVIGRIIEGGAIEPTIEAEIYNIAVVPSAQQRGLGQLLLDYFIERVKQHDGVIIWLEVRESNEKAISFYKKNGFERVQTRNHFYNNPREHALLMRLSL